MTRRSLWARIAFSAPGYALVFGLAYLAVFWDWLVCTFWHRALSVPDEDGDRWCRCGRRWPF